jgi:hypothetical protein
MERDHDGGALPPRPAGEQKRQADQADDWNGGASPTKPEEAIDHFRKGALVAARIFQPLKGLDQHRLNPNHAPV